MKVIMPIITIISAMFIALTATAQEKIIWSSTYNGINFILKEGANGKSNLILASLPAGPKSVSHIADLREIRVRLPDARFRQGVINPPTNNGFIERVVFSGQHEIFLTLTKDSWSSRGMQERKNEIAISGLRAITEIKPIAKKENIAPIIVESAVLEKGSFTESKPIVKIWSAEIKEVPIDKKKKPEQTTKDAPEEVRASLALEDQETPIDIEVSSQNILITPQINAEVEVENRGQKPISVQFVLENDSQNSPISFDPKLLKLAAREKKSVIIKAVNENIAEELILSGGIFLNIEGKIASTPIKKLRLFVQPKSGTARVSWLREEAGITFINRGDITTIFKNVKVCNPSCHIAGDIILKPSKEYLLKAPKTASIMIEQQVGNNKQSGVIPAAE